MHVQMDFELAFIAIAITPATSQPIVPIATRVTTDRIFVVMKEE